MSISSTPCHTCRRRRVKCDGALPTCHKCRQSKHECLGYNKLILWNRGIASRGKMMNKTFTADKLRPDSAPISAQPVGRPAASSDNENGGSLVPAKSLKDPHFQGLSNTNQFYLYYFGTELSRTYILYNAPTGNPFKFTVTYTPEYEAFRQIVIANSAMAIYRKTQNSLKPLSSPQPGNGLLYYPVLDPYRDGLTAKHRAIRLLAQTIDKEILDTDTVFGCILMFSYLSFMNSDQDEILVHLQGLGEILKNPTLTACTKAKAAWVMRNGLSSDSVLFDALQTALFPTRAPDTPLYTLGRPMLDALDDHHLFACPWEIVAATTKIADLLREGSEAQLSGTVSDEIRFAVGQVESIDASKWASSSPAPGILSGRLGQLETRMHIAEAYKSAFYLFVARLLPADICLSTTVRSHICRITYHLSLIPVTDDGFRATSWPAFVAGLESEDHATMAFTTSHLKKLSSLLPWEYLMRAVELLERTMQIRFTPEGFLKEKHWVAMSKKIMAEYPIIQHGWKFIV